MISADLDRKLTDAAFTLMMAAAPAKRDEIRGMLCMVIVHIRESLNDELPKLKVIRGGRVDAL